MHIGTLKRRNIAIAAVLALLVGAVGAFAIIGGEEAAGSKWPWIAQVRIEGEGEP